MGDSKRPRLEVTNGAGRDDGEEEDGSDDYDDGGVRRRRRMAVRDEHGMTCVPRTDDLGDHDHGGADDGSDDDDDS